MDWRERTGDKEMSYAIISAGVKEVFPRGMSAGRGEVSQIW